MAMSLAPVALRKAQHVTQSRRVLREISANGIYLDLHIALVEHQVPVFRHRDGLSSGEEAQTSTRLHGMLAHGAVLGIR